jgi:hypothetical protein
MSKEINFKDAGCTDTLGSALNHYSQNFDFKDSKKWALEWIKVHLPDEYDRLKDEKEHKFSNRGFVCRMMKNGLVLSDQQKHDLVKFFLNMPTTLPEVEERDTAAPKRKPVEKVNTVIFQMEDVVDAILSDNEPRPVEIPIDKSKLAEAQAWLEKEIIEAQEQVEKQKAILEQLTSVYERCGGIRSKIAPAKPKAKPKETASTLNADKAKAIKTMTYQKRDEELGIDSLSPARLVGAKAAILYNTKYRTLLRFVAKPGESLAVKGSSIRNHDEEKSTSKKVRKPKDFFAVEDRWKAYDLLNTTERKATTHVSSEMMIVETK